MARQALAEGWQVAGLVRTERQAAIWRGRGVECVIGDIAEMDWHARLSAVADYVVNAVSASGGDYARTYVDGNCSIRQWARGGNVGTLVYTSTTGVYTQSDDAVVDEESPVGGDPKADILVKAEQVWTEFPPSHSPRRFFVLRLGGLYGPGRHHLLNEIQRGEGVIPGRGDYFINYLHREDAVRAIMSALMAPKTIKNRVYNVVDGKPVLREEVAEWLALRTGSPMPIFDERQQTPRMLRRGRPSPSRIVRGEKIREELYWFPMVGDFRMGVDAILLAQRASDSK